LKRYFEIFVTNDFFSIFWRTAALKQMATDAQKVKKEEEKSN